jgi:hypothetical protein
VGRIAKCPRLQQNISSDDLPFCSEVVGSSVLSIPPSAQMLSSRSPSGWWSHQVG